MGCFWSCFLSFFMPLGSAGAQPSPPAMPAAPVSAESLPAEEAGPVVIELYSSQACVFCPQADRLFADMLGQPGIIGLACHVDYFDVKEGSLAKSFCSERQSAYMNLLRAGPGYTPQMVINGRYDVVGYHMDDVAETIKKASANGVLPLAITAGGDGHYLLSAGNLEKNGRPLRLWIAVLDRPHDLTVAEGRNRGQKITYNNIVSDLKDMGLWDAAGAEKGVSLTFAEGQAGFAALLHDEASGAIVAAGQYSLPPVLPAPPPMDAPDAPSPANAPETPAPLAPSEN